MTRITAGSLCAGGVDHCSGSDCGKDLLEDVDVCLRHYNRIRNRRTKSSSQSRIPQIGEKDTLFSSDTWCNQPLFRVDKWTAHRSCLSSPPTSQSAYDTCHTRSFTHWCTGGRGTCSLRENVFTHVLTHQWLCLQGQFAWLQGIRNRPLTPWLLCLLSHSCPRVGGASWVKCENVWSW